jgi:hypothetical protein
MTRINNRGFLMVLRSNKSMLCGALIMLLIGKTIEGFVIYYYQDLPFNQTREKLDYITRLFEISRESLVQNILDFFQICGNNLMVVSVYLACGFFATIISREFNSIRLGRYFVTFAVLSGFISMFIQFGIDLGMVKDLTNEQIIEFYARGTMPHGILECYIFSYACLLAISIGYDQQDLRSIYQRNKYKITYVMLIFVISAIFEAFITPMVLSPMFKSIV